jgi:alkanesulfonate monooxygenase SsuD/methylene tetrahydromethanopterin reductase-like flavin-dependent oxidoreductase (luciferase family)
VLLAPTLAEVEEKKRQDPFGWRDWSLSYTVAGTPSEVIEYFQTLADQGVQYFIVSTLPDDRETLRLLAQEVMPALHIPAYKEVGGTH